MRQQVIPTRKTLALLFLLTALCTISSAQDFQIRADIDLVVVPVTVRSGEELVSGLTKDDFQIFEDEKPQTITNFTIDPVPLSAVVLIDTGLSEHSFGKVRDSMTALAGAFSDFDEVSVYRFDKFVTKMIDFTNDNLAVENVMKKLQDPAPAATATLSSGPFSANGPIINGIPVIPGGPQPSHRASEQGAKVLHDAVFAASEALAKRQADRRRIIFVVSDGQSKGDEHSFDDVVDTLLDRGIQFYAVGTDMAFLARRFSVLNSYSERTGGDACYLNSTERMEACYARLAEEARNQYVLAYVSTNEVTGSLPVFREIEVRTPGREVELSHRQGYFQYP